MNTQEIEAKLTPAAKVALKELVDNYEQQLLLNAARTAEQATGGHDEISVRDIVSGAESYGAESRNIKLIRRKKMLQLMALTGVAYMIAGIAYLLYMSTNMSRTQMMGLTATFLGAIISLVSYLLSRTMKERYSDSDIRLRGRDIQTGIEIQNAELELIKRWTMIELLSRDLLSSLLGESRANAPLGQVMNILTEKNIWNKQDYNNARMLLDMRNGILHKGTNYTNAEVNKALASLESLIQKIETQMKKTVE